MASVWWVGILVLCGHLPPGTIATGSMTYLTDNGFPTNFLDNIINSPIVQRKLKSRWKWEVWDVVPGIHSYQLYVFNITNPNEVEKGQTPNLQQLGPYYYREHRYKFDVSINLDLTVNYERNYSYVFDKSKSKGSEDDLVNVLNLPLIVFSSIVSGSKIPGGNDAVNDLTSSGGETLVRRGVKVGDFLYNGIDIRNYGKHVNLLKNDGNDTVLGDLIDEFASGKFGVLKLKNGPHEKAYVVDSGLTNQNKVGNIVSWNSQTSLSWWNGSRCNMINGSDSSVFPPYLTPTRQLQLFDLDLCRSVAFEYGKDMTFKGVVAGRQYNISPDTLEDPNVFEPNKCFCSDPHNCLSKGVIDVSKCKGGFPLVMSYAHFLDANPEYLKSVNGLAPDPLIHRTQIDVEPVTGAVINYRKRFQWNIWLKPLDGIEYFRNIRSIVFPVIWNSDDFALNPDKAQLLVEELASQQGGVGETAYDLINKLNNHNSAPTVISFSFNIIIGSQIIIMLLSNISCYFYQ